MSLLFAKVFGGKKQPPIQTTTEAIQQLRETEDLLVKRQDLLETKIQQEITIARSNGTKNKRAAIQALKRKKRYEKQLQQIDGTLSTLEMQRETLESANTNTAVLTTMKNAADALKAAHQHIDVDQVQDMMEDIVEQQDLAKEISDVISNPGFGQDVDEDELERELDELEQEELDKELFNIQTTDALPAVPATALPTVPTKTKAKQEEDDDLKELEQWAS